MNQHSRYRLFKTDTHAHEDLTFPNETAATVDEFAEQLRAHGVSVKVMGDDEFANFVAENYNIYDVSYVLTPI